MTNKSSTTTTLKSLGKVPGFTTKYLELEDNPGASSQYFELNSTSHRGLSRLKVVPYPSQGHINPLLQFAKHIASKGVKATLATTRYTVGSICAPQIGVETISDGFEEGGYSQARNIEFYLKSFREQGSRTLIQLIHKFKHAPRYFWYDHSCCGLLIDAKKTVDLKPDWSKGCSRLDAAHLGLHQYQEAISAYKKGLKIDPTNEVFKTGVANEINQQPSCTVLVVDEAHMYELSGLSPDATKNTLNLQVVLEYYDEIEAEASTFLLHLVEKEEN
ncbi:uncharacterized protein LOC120163302 [Hibiscus syriacus]|uniref:uncharacterized protein LOC120163302 n=1 Tax=Hibiscus syriacus TaxID=106335 RepID=UPI001923DA6E|nr:uncharacterized protein LOC120163302 [Hibiscus syriacus]